MTRGLSAARLAASLPWLELVGLDMHVGSQLALMDAYERGLERVTSLLDAVKAEGITSIRYLDIGGGLAVPYEDEDPPDLKLYGRIVREVARRTKLEILVEPGRFMVADAGTLLTRVLYRKRSGGREIAVTDAGMTELLRPRITRPITTSSRCGRDSGSQCASMSSGRSARAVTSSRSTVRCPTSRQAT
jgi:diaminopimelate decarboxylase